MPVTIAVADEPNPRPCGTALRQSSVRPAGGSTPSSAQATCIARCTRWVASSGTAPSPSPETVTDEARALA